MSIILSSINYFFSEDQLCAPNKSENGITMGDNIINDS
jgi:hypothetical protein